MDGNPNLAASLDLPNADCVVAEMLAPHAHNIGSPLAGIEKQRKRQSRPRADSMVALELLDLALSPTVIAVALGGHPAHVASWIIQAKPNLDGVLHQRAQRAAQR